MPHALDASRFGKRNGHARGALKSSAQDVLDDFDELRKDVNKLAGAAQRAAREEAAEISHRVTAQIDAMKGQVRTRAYKGVDQLSDQVRDRPATALGIALGAGLLIGIALTPRR